MCFVIVCGKIKGSVWYQYSIILPVSVFRYCNMSVLLSFISFTIVIKSDGCGSIPRQLRQAFDIIAGIELADTAEFYNCYYKEKSQIPHRVLINFYQSGALQKCKITVDGTLVLYDDVIVNLGYVEMRHLRTQFGGCKSCKRIPGFYIPMAEDILKSYNSRIVISIHNSTRFCTDLKNELAETLELIHRIIGTPLMADTLKLQETQQVLVLKKLTEYGTGARVMIDGKCYYQGPQNPSHTEWGDYIWCSKCIILNTYL